MDKNRKRKKQDLNADVVSSNDRRQRWNQKKTIVYDGTKDKPGR